MRRMEKLGFILMILSVTACAPVVYDAHYGAPARDTYVYVNFEQPAYYNETAYRPIEVTLYADNSYMGVYFQPRHLVIYDGQYVEIPVRDRRGRDTKIYAHYHQNNLHFDTDRNDHGINGSSRFDYDNRWENGYKYSNINAGKDYDLTGLQMQIRNAPTSRNNQTHKVTENKENRPSERQVTVITDKTVKKVVRREGKSPIYNSKSVNEQFRPAVINAKRPEIIEKTVRDAQSHQMPGKTAKSMKKEQTASRVPIQKVNYKEVRNNERNNAEPQKVSSFTKKIEKKGEHETVAMKQQQRPRSQNNLSAEKNEEAGITSQNNDNNARQPGWTKAIDKNLGKSKKSNLALNEVD